MLRQIPPHGFRTFVILWFSQSMSVIGSGLTFFVMTIWLTTVLYPKPEQKAELAFALTAISLAFALPTVFGAPIAGSWADRHDRKHTMMIMDFLSGCLSLTLATLAFGKALTLWVLVILMVFYSLLGAFHSAAFDTSYIMIVPEKQLTRANGMMQTTWSLSGILSPGIAAAIIALPGLARQGVIPGSVGLYLSRLADGTSLAIVVDAVTFFLVAGTLLFLFIPSPKRTDLGESGELDKSLWADVKVGALYIRYRQPLLWLLGTFAVANFASSGAFQVLVPLLVKFNLFADWSAHGFTFETALALLLSVGGLGGVVSGFVMSTWGGLKMRRVYGVIIPLIIAGAAQIVYGISQSLYLTAAMDAIAGGMIPVMNSHSTAIWQIVTPPELQGRVFSVRRLIAQFTWPISAAFAGWAGGSFNPGIVIATLGAVLTIFCAIQLFNPYLLRVEDKRWLDELASGQNTKQERNQI